MLLLKEKIEEKMLSFKVNSHTFRGSNSGNFQWELVLKVKIHASEMLKKNEKMIIVTKLWFSYMTLALHL